MKKTRRTAKVGEMLREEITAILRREIDDPALSLATITGVEVSTDFRVARVYVSILGDDEAKEKALDVLEKSRGRVRGLLGRRISLRVTPDLDFRLDTTAEYAASIEKILHEVLPPQPIEEEENDETEEEKDRDVES